MIHRRYLAPHFYARERLWRRLSCLWRLSKYSYCRWTGSCKLVFHSPKLLSISTFFSSLWIRFLYSCFLYISVGASPGPSSIVSSLWLLLTKILATPLSNTFAHQMKYVLTYSHFIPIFNMDSMKSWMMKPKFALSHDILIVGTSRIICRYICFNFTLPPTFKCLATLLSLWIRFLSSCFLYFCYCFPQTFTQYPNSARRREKDRVPCIYIYIDK